MIDIYPKLFPNAGVAHVNFPVLEFRDGDLVREVSQAERAAMDRLEGRWAKITPTCPEADELANVNLALTTAMQQAEEAATKLAEAEATLEQAIGSGGDVTKARERRDKAEQVSIAATRFMGQLDRRKATLEAVVAKRKKAAVQDEARIIHAETCRELEKLGEELAGWMRQRLGRLVELRTTADLAGEKS